MRYKGESVVIKKRYYDNGRMALILDCASGEPYGKITVNVPEEHLLKDEMFVKDYSENEGMLSWCQEIGLVIKVIAYVEQGWVKIPKCKIDLVKLKELAVLKGATK